ncbi:Ig-like domain-containing protein, partial [Burkholderia sp. LMU1-1-1.1]|uniref:Ig-like domain-containing protein n=1 Tax=Burkholderia sp. LMU1-1-1.1 TaxID=3135266 RepID=UPI003425C5D2
MSTTTSTSTTSATTTADYLAAAAAPVSLAPPTLVSISDTGVKGDFITSATRPQFAAQLDVAFGGYTIALYDGDTKVGSAIVQTSGGWNIISSTLGNGAHNLRLALTDPAGNVVATSPTQQISIKTQAEAPSAPLLLPSVDSGASDSDHVTNVNVLRFSGSAEAGSAVSLYNGRTEVGSAVADASGKWVMDNVFLDDGSYQLTAVATDVARNISAPSASLNLVIDTEAPQALTLALAPASDSGHAGDGVTNVATPTVTGATEAGATVLLFDGATQLGSAVADAQGNWSIASATLADGAHQLAVRITDVAGNVSTAGATLAVTIDGAAPAAPGAPVLAAASDSGASNADQITNIATPRLGGMAEGGATIALYDGAQLVASTVAAAGGAWQIDDLRFADGAHSLTVKATDAAGNVSAASPALLLTVDTAVPAAPAGLDLLAGSDSGSSDQDNITNATLPVIAGTAEAGARVALYDGATLLGSGVADAAGQWQITVERALANGVHSLTAEATDAAGNVSPRSAALDVTIDTTAALPPTALDLVAAADSGAADGDDLTNVAAPVITGKAEAGARVALFDGDRELGSAVAGADGVWRITSAALADGEHHLTARSSSLTGTVSAPSEALVVTIDTAAPAAPEAPRLAAGADTGSSDSDHITNITTPALSGTAEAGATVTLFDGTRQVGTVVADASGAWRYTPEQRLENGEHSLTATATDAAGNISAASPALVFTIDSRAPAAPAALDLVAADDSGSAADDDITSVTRPAITGTAERGARVDLYDGDTLLGSAVAGDDGGWRIDVAQPLADGAHQLRAQATDVAGNTSVKSAVLAITVDTTVPTAPTELDLPTTADHGVSDSDDLTNAAAPTITGKADAGATVTLFDGDIRLGTAVADASGAWSINTGPLADGTHHLTASTSAKTGLVSAPSAALVVTIDTAAPATPGAPLLAAGDDSGLSNTDGVTNVAAPRLGGSAEAGASIALLDGGVQIATAVADANGAWSIGEHLFADGAHQLTVVATDAAGNVSAASQALTLTVDTGAPAAPSGLDLLAGSDGGVSNGDNITNVAQPTLAGQAAPLAAVALYDGATLIGSTIANAAGNWEITVGAALADGVHSLTATATDLAGNTSPASPALSVTVLTAPPATPSGLDLAGAADSGASNSDNLTNATTPLITGKAGANALVTVYDGATVVATTVADAAGLWSVTSAALADGAHHLSASAADVAGNVSAPSAELVVTVDTQAPALGALALAAGSDSGRSDSDGITNVTTPTVTGTAEAGATVALFDGARQLGTVMADANGAWSFKTAALSAGAHTLTATATDAAGNVAAPAALTVTIDSGAPAAPTALDLTAASDSGTSGTDNLTNVTTPTIAGKAEANASVALFDGTVLVGTGLADQDGNWQITVTQPLKDGAHGLTAQATDAAGNLSVKSTAIAVTIDTTPLAAPGAPDLDIGSDTGSLNTDNVTNAATPKFTGTASASTLIQLFDGDTLVGSATTTSTGAWSIVSAALADGAHTLTVRSVDPAGNLSAPSAPLVVTIDRAAPGAPGAPVLDAASDTGVSDADKLTKDA